MKKVVMIFTIILFCTCIDVKANIICNDGKESDTCVDCHQGCCSGHDGCLKEKQDNNNSLKYIALGAGATGVVSAAAYAGSRAGAKKSK